MTEPFLALITPLGAGAPAHPIAPGGPPAYPAHPIPPTVWPNPPAGSPPGFWGGVAPPHPDQGLPGQPPGIWGGRPPNYVDIGLPPPPPLAPGEALVLVYMPPHGMQWVVVDTNLRPTHPIELPQPGHPIAGAPTPEPKK